MNLRLLKNYIRRIIKEDLEREDLMTSKDPVDWVDAAWKSPSMYVVVRAGVRGHTNKYEAMTSAATEFGLYELGRGSSRIVYDMNDGKNVLKLALNDKGLEQNKLEAFAGSDPQIDKIVANVVDHSDQFAWLVSQRVTQLQSEGEFERLVGVSWNDLRTAVGLKQAQDMDATAVPVRRATSQSAASGGRNCLRGQAFLDYIKNYLSRYDDMLPGDIAKYDSWGATSDGCVVLLDYGITGIKFRQMYNRPVPKLRTGGGITLGKRG